MFAAAIPLSFLIFSRLMHCHAEVSHRNVTQVARHTAVKGRAESVYVMLHRHTCYLVLRTRY